MGWLHPGCDSDFSEDCRNFGDISVEKVLQNRLVSALASRSGFEAAIADAVARSSIVLCTPVSADLIVVAASRSHGMRDETIIAAWRMEEGDFFC